MQYNPTGDTPSDPSRGAFSLWKWLRLPRLQTFDALSASKDFRLLWIGNFCAQNAQWLQLLTVGWLVRSLTSDSALSALLVVMAGGLNTVPSLLVGPVGGVLGDRFDRRKLVMGIQSFMAVFSLSFAFLVGVQLVSIWHVYAYVLISGVCLTVTMPTRMALVANTVPRELLSNAITANVVTFPITRMIGPFIGGVLITTIGFFWNFTLESFLYAGNVLAFIWMRTPYRAQRPAGPQRSILGDLIDGFRYIWSKNRVLLYLTVLALIPNTLLEPIMFLLPVFTEEVLRRGPETGGYLVSIVGVGGLTMILFFTSFGFVMKKGRIVLVTVIIASLFVVLLSYSFVLALALLLLYLFGATQNAFRTANAVLIQILSPDDMRGRMNTLQSYSMGFMFISALALGWFAGLTTVSFAMAAIGIIGMVVGISFYLVSDKIRKLT